MQTRDTKAVAQKIVAILDGDKRNAAKHFAESIPDKQRREKLIAEMNSLTMGSAIAVEEHETEINIDDI